MNRLLALMIVLLGSVQTGAEASERYIVPIWAGHLQGASGTWQSQVTVSNPGATPVSVRVTRVFPLKTEACPTCTGIMPTIEIEPYGSRFIYPTHPSPGERLAAGAFEVEASAPVKFDHVVYGRVASLYGDAPSPIVQRIEVARRWLEPGRRTIHGVPGGSPTNVFVVNPSEQDLEISIWTGYRGYNEIRIVVPPTSTQVIALPTTRCGAAPCPPGPAIFPPLPRTVEIDALGPSMVSVSSLGRSVDGAWAVFTLADEAGW